MRRVWPGGSRHSDGATRAENTFYLFVEIYEDIETNFSSSDEMRWEIRPEYW